MQYSTSRNNAKYPANKGFPAPYMANSVIGVMIHAPLACSSYGRTKATRRLSSSERVCEECGILTSCSRKNSVVFELIFISFPPSFHLSPARLVSEVLNEAGELYSR